VNHQPSNREDRGFTSINQLLFTSPQLDATTPHTIMVMYTGDSSTDSETLVVDYFDITTLSLNLDDGGTGSGTTVDGQSSSVPGPSAPGAMGPRIVKVAEIASGVVAAGVILAVLAVITWVIKLRECRRQPRHWLTGSGESPSHALGLVEPFLTIDLNAQPRSSATMTETSPPAPGTASTATGKSNAHSSMSMTSTNGHSPPSSASALLASIRSSPPNSTGTQSQAPSLRPTIVLHQDSGMRVMPEHVGREVIEIPPGYSVD
jgi:hypothetical protein